MDNLDNALQLVAQVTSELQAMKDSQAHAPAVDPIVNAFTTAVNPEQFKANLVSLGWAIPAETPAEPAAPAVSNDEQPAS